MTDCVKLHKAESQMTLVSSRGIPDESPSGGWWVSRTRLEVALLAMVAVSLFLLIAVCLAMAAIIAGSSPNSLFAEDISAGTSLYSHKFKRSLPSSELNDRVKSRHEILLDPELALKFSSQSQDGDGFLPPVIEENLLIKVESESERFELKENTTIEIITSTTSPLLPGVSQSLGNDTVHLPDSVAETLGVGPIESNVTEQKTSQAPIAVGDESSTKQASGSDVDKTEIEDDIQKPLHPTEASSAAESSVTPTDSSISKANSVNISLRKETSQSTGSASFDSSTTALNSIPGSDIKKPIAAIKDVSDPSELSVVSCKASGGQTSSTSEFCLTKSCITSASELIANMDSQVDPCEDFFEYACGNYIKSRNIPDEKSSITQFSDVSDVLQEKLRMLIESEDSSEDTPSGLMVKQLYKSCMNTERIAEQGLQPLKDILREMGGWPAVEGAAWGHNRFDWVQNVYINRRLGYSVDYLLDFSVTTNIKNSTWRIIDIDQPSFGMSREYLMRGLNDSDVRAYLDYQVSLAALLGANRTAAQLELTESLLFEIQLANFSLPNEKRRNASELYNKMTVAELQARVPNIPWLSYINTLLAPFTNITEDEEVIVNVPSYLENLDKLLLKTPKRVIANFLMWRASAASISYLSEDARDLQLEYSKKITGTGKRNPRWKECIGAVSGSLSYAVSKLYAEKFFKKDAKAAADEMVSYVRREFDKILRAVDWMDDETRLRAINKSQAITSHIAYPDELLDESKIAEVYKDLQISDGELLSNMRNLTIYSADYSFKRLREVIDKNDWKRHGTAAVVNAYYSRVDNSINFPAGILQGTFFNAERPKYLNFGSIGFVIGHEITHGFDDVGRQFDYKGDLKEWWEPETKAKFIEKSKCIIHQYGNYTAPEVGLKLNGVNTQGENIADNGGIKEAYYAYNQYVSDHGEENPLPALGLTAKQLFWLSAANVWCGKYRPESLKFLILTGAHSPVRFRVNGELSNSPEFSRDWNCKLNSKMNPSQKCSVW
ncbi:neprilysin-2 [Hyalella azteca]|uniref:Neprilysin-2 n=1 Tax=Hyalella azteca TaxID=294128 RepID=A0A8B7N5Z9_HYAAZ|nr:neprilysin-2 [Hyalella azteca]